MTRCRRLHAVVMGRVQGVGFRYSVRHWATRLGLDGWVRNLPNGDVEVEALGDEAALQELLERLRQGPPGASVHGVRATWSDGDTDGDGFRITF